ncbi:uncharacterized protein LOC130613864 [Hydractinia symbiolongicarpus]|uniref:uncharacterized protein LOC130613864 n=1 Tax=Hydractinia symbiolongicarpus TaxID=13093 RepID=UPI00254FED70|nr:uncharacterized protein LOC130613864 [Hydractinia symbiolongicarpus]
MSSYQSKRPEYKNTPGDSYYDSNGFARWNIEHLRSLTTIGVQKLSESVRAYSYLLITSQTSTRSSILGNTGPALDCQQVFLNNFENIINRHVDIAEDIKRFQDTLQYARSKVDYVVGENVFMLPSDMNLRIGEVNNYNNEILVSKSDFGLGTNLKVNTEKKPDLKPIPKEKKPDPTTSKKKNPDPIPPKKTNPTIPKKKTTDNTKSEVPTGEITHEEEKIAVI